MDPIEHDSLIMECGFARTNTKQAVCADPGMNLCIWTDPVSSSLFRPIKKRKKLFTSLELCSWARFPTHAEPMRHCCFLSPHINFSYASSSPPHPLPPSFPLLPSSSSSSSTVFSSSFLILPPSASSSSTAIWSFLFSFGIYSHVVCPHIDTNQYIPIRLGA